MKLGLYSYWRSSSSYRVRIVLELKGINYEYKNVNLLKRVKNPDAEPLSDDINPMNQIPVLEVQFDEGHNEKIYLSQSLPIIEWLQDVYPDTYSILPKDPLTRQLSRAMAEVINSSIQPLQNLPTLYEIDRLGGDKMDWAKKVINKGLTALELMVKQVDGRFCAGNDISIADCFLIPQIYNAQRFGIDVKSYKHLYTIYERCMELDAFDKASPERQPDCPGV